MTTALMVSNSFARRMAEVRAEHRRGVSIEDLRSVREPRFAAEAPSDADKSVRDRGYYMVGALAIVPICGPIWLEESFWSRVFGGVTVPGLTRAFATIERDPKAQRVLLEIDSPGGAAQEHEAIAALKSLRATKPVHAVACVDACSAAYWIACHADEVVAKPDSMIGSIGVKLAGALFDVSAYLEDEGVKAHGISTGKHKVTGEFGLPIDEEQLAHMRSIVEGLFTMFGGDVAERRGVSIDALRSMEGAVYVGAEAVRKGLADRVVQSTDELVRELAGMAPGVRAERKRADLEPTVEPSPDAPEPDEPISQETIMSTKNGTGAAPGPQGNAESKTDTALESGATNRNTALESGATSGPASFSQLRAIAGNLPEDARNDFIVSAQEKGLSVDAATQAAFAAMGTLLSKARTETSEAANAAKVAAENAEKLKNEPSGVAPQTSSGTPSGKTYQDLVIAACKADPKLTLNGAMYKVATSHPKAHQAWCEANCPTINVPETVSA